MRLPEGDSFYLTGDKGGNAMTERKVGSREEWLAAREELMSREKELTRRNDDLARERRELPSVLVDKEYSFETDRGTKTLAELFDGPLAAPRLPLHVRPRVHGGVPNLLGRGGHLRRRCSAPERVRRGGTHG
jgi:uncharacterized protein DUF899